MPHQESKPRLRVLYVALSAPRPAASGNAQRVDQIARALVQQSEVKLCVLLPRANPEAEAATSAAYDSMFLAPPPQAEWVFGLMQLRSALRGQDRWLAKYRALPQLACVREEVVAFGPDVVIAGYTMLVRFTQLLGLPLGRTIVDHPDPVSLNFRRRMRRARGIRKLQLFVDTRSLRAAERECGGALENWVVSEVDRVTVERLIEARAEIVPNVIGDEEFDFEASGVRATEEPTLGFVGGYTYEPNAEAALAFMDVSERLGANVPHHALLVGANPTPAMQRRAAQMDHVTLTGFVPELRSVLRNVTVFLVPIRTGSGTKLKILQAMAMGIPVVTTPMGAEGLPIVKARLGLIADDTEGLVAACRNLLQDPDLRLELAGRARAWARDHASATCLERIVAARLAALAPVVAPQLGRR